MKITVFTPTYNRGYIIRNLYESLIKQTYRDFEWIVVDDGSDDGTETIFEEILSSDRGFPIRYLKTDNGGKHRAINKGVQLASGEMFFIVDSDDDLPSDSLERIVRVEATLSSTIKPEFAGVCGIRADRSDKGIGSTFDGEYLDITMLDRAKHNIDGDKAEVFYTNILRSYPFPEFDGENFVTECVVWDKIAFDGYKLRFFNDIVYYCEYLDDGLTRNYKKVYDANPQSYGLYIHQCIKFGKIKKEHIRDTYRTYLQTHRHNIRIRKLAKYLHVSVFRLLPIELELMDLAHLPNRILMRIVGQKRYEKIKRMLKK